MAKLNRYMDKEGREYIAIITEDSYEEELAEGGDLELMDSIEIDEDMSYWPTDRILKQESSF